MLAIGSDDLINASWTMAKPASRGTAPSDYAVDAASALRDDMGMTKREAGHELGYR